MKQEFERVRAVIGELADALDEEFPNYIVEEDKTLQYKQMIISNKSDYKQDPNSLLKSLSPDSNQQNQTTQTKSKYHPFDDELQYKFYMQLPDFSRHVIEEDEAQELMKRDKLENDELMAIEIKKIQELQDIQEREGKVPDPMPDEQELKLRIQKMK